MSKRKPFQDLEFRDAFMFAAVMEDAELCRQTLERILGFPIRKVTVRAENAIFLNSDFRGVRLDVYAEDDDNSIYDVELQTYDQCDLPKRCRLYQGQMDVNQLKPRASFNHLPNSYIIFICTFDPFGQQLYRYTFRETCAESGALLNDGSCKIILSTRGKNRDEVPPELIDFLAYAEHSSPATAGSDSLLQQLEERIRTLKKNSRLEDNYMLFQEMLDMEREEGRAEERVNTEAQRERADAAEQRADAAEAESKEQRERADAAEAEIARLRAELELRSKP